jgi:hypothetical protein
VNTREKQEEMLGRIQEYIGWPIVSNERESRITALLASQALAYIEALRLWKDERNELFLPRFIAPTDDLTPDEVK